MDGFSPLELTILRAKGLTDDQLGTLTGAGLAAKADFATIGDAATLVQIVWCSDSDVGGSLMRFRGVVAGERRR